LSFVSVFLSVEFDTNQAYSDLCPLGLMWSSAVIQCSIFARTLL